MDGDNKGEIRFEANREVKKKTTRRTRFLAQLSDRDGPSLPTIIQFVYLRALFAFPTEQLIPRPWHT